MSGGGDAYAAGDPAARPRGPWAWIAAYVALVAVVTLSGLSDPFYDDAYFFKRFAHNALSGDGFAWNAADGPVHACTSQLYMWWTTLVVAAFETHWVVAARIANAAFLALAGALAFRWVAAHASADPRAFALCFLALASPPILLTVGTGMETAMTLCVLMVVLTVLTRGGEPGRAIGPGAVALCLLLAYLARPDLAMVVIVVAFWPASRSWRPAGAALLACAFALACVWLGLRAYYGSALPLAFFMKTLALDNYAPEVIALGQQVKLAHLWAAAFFCAPSLALGAGAALGAVRRAGGELHPQGRASRRLAGPLFVAGLAGIAYHGLLTNEIMGYRARFYAPSMLVLALAGAHALGTAASLQVASPTNSTNSRSEPPARGAAVLQGLGLLALFGATAVAYRQGWAPDSRGDPMQQIGAAAYVGTGLAYVVLALATFVPSAWPSRVAAAVCAVGALLAWPLRVPLVRPDVQIISGQRQGLSSLRGLGDVKRCLPGDATVFHSEMGIPGLMLPDARLVDLVGIVSAEFSIKGQSFAQVCEVSAPAAIFLPHKNYADLNQKIRESECFGNYQRVVERSSAPLFVRRDLAAEFLGCASEVQRWRRVHRRR